MACWNIHYENLGDFAIETSMKPVDFQLQRLITREQLCLISKWLPTLPLVIPTSIVILSLPTFTRRFLRATLTRAFQQRAIHLERSHGLRRFSTGSSLSSPSFTHSKLLQSDAQICLVDIPPSLHIGCFGFVPQLLWGNPHLATFFDQINSQIFPFSWFQLHRNLAPGSLGPSSCSCTAAQCLSSFSTLDIRGQNREIS